MRAEFPSPWCANRVFAALYKLETFSTLQRGSGYLILSFPIRRSMMRYAIRRCSKNRHVIDIILVGGSERWDIPAGLYRAGDRLPVSSGVIQELLDAPRLSHLTIERARGHYTIGLTKHLKARWRRLLPFIIRKLHANLDPHGSLEEVKLETEGVLQVS